MLAVERMPRVTRLLPRWSGWKCALISATLLIAAPALALDPSRALTQYVLSTWQSESGLPQNSVYTLLQSRDGYLWIGTEEGLVRFDGVRFEVFDKHNTPAIRANWIRVLREGSDGSIWVGIIGGGLLQLKNGVFTAFTARDGLPSDAVWDVAEEKPGVLLVATDAGVVRLVNGRFERLELGAALHNEHIRAIARDASGRLWVGSDGGGCARSSANGYERVEGLPSEFVTAFRLARDGAMWVATSSGVVRFARDTTTTTLHGELPNENVRTIVEDREGSIWIGTYGGGLTRVRGGKIESISTREGLAADDVTAICEDHEGDLWVGTGGGGLVRLASRLFLMFGRPEGLKDDNVRSVLQSRDGALWMGTRGGLTRVKDSERTTYTTANGLAGNVVYSLFEDRDGTIWAGTEKGVTKIAGTALRNYTTRDGLGHETVRAIVADRNGSIWIATAAGLSRLDGDRFHTFTKRDGLRDDSILSLRVASDGVLWIGTRLGVTLFDGTTFRSPKDASLEQSPVIAIDEDDEHAMWLATGGKGLFRMKGGHVARVTSAHGLFDDTLAVWLDDGHGNFWSSSNRGVFRVRKSDVRAVADGRQSRVESIVYDVGDGLRSNECNGGSQPAGWRARDGRLLFGTIRGVASVDPVEALKAQPPPRVVIEQLTTGGRLFSPHGTVRLAPGSHDLNVHYTALALSAPEKIRFRYRIDGFGEGWVDAGTRRVAYFTNVPAGRYRFLVEGTSGGAWSAPAELSFELQPRFFETTWFRALCVGLAILLLLLLDRLRHWRLRAAERRLTALVAERTRELEAALKEAERARAEAQERGREAEEANRAKSYFLASTSHELRTPMNSIIGFTDILEERLRGQVEPRMTHFLHLVGVSARHLLQIINDILDLSKVEMGKMEVFAEPVEIRPMIERVCATMTTLAAQASVALVIDVDETLPAIETDPGKVKQILFNLLSNAVKFSPPGSSVLITARRSGEWMTLSVVDHGSGISPADMLHVFEQFRQFGAARNAAIGSGLGLSLVKRYAELLGGRVEVDSKMGEGSTFQVWLPLRPSVDRSERAAAANV